MVAPGTGHILPVSVEVPEASMRQELDWSGHAVTIGACAFF